MTTPDEARAAPDFAALEHAEHQLAESKLKLASLRRSILLASGYIVKIQICRACGRWSKSRAIPGVVYVDPDDKKEYPGYKRAYWIAPDGREFWLMTSAFLHCRNAARRACGPTSCAREPAKVKS